MQWYEKKPDLYEREKKLMKKRFPDAKEIIRPDGTLAWQLTLQLSGSDEYEPWTVLLVYSPQFPEKTAGDPIKIIPLKPGYSELLARLRKVRGEFINSLPHSYKSADGKTEYLSVLRPGSDSNHSAVRIGMATLEWALYFELSLLDKDIWEKWAGKSYLQPEAEENPLKKQKADAQNGTCYEQWYEKNEKLFKTEIAVMKKFYPKSKYGFFEKTRNMYWKVSARVSQSGLCEDWEFLLVYHPEHPAPDGIRCNSVEIMPLNPSYEQLRNRVNDTKGKYFAHKIEVPHTYTLEDSEVRCLTIEEIPVSKENNTINSAVSYVHRAVEWALYFELAMRENRVWNKWVESCGKEYLRISDIL